MNTMASRTADPWSRHYLEEIGSIPLLSREEEVRLSRLVAEGDERARETMVTANLRLVVHIAREYSHHGLDFDDLVAEGNLGLIRAVESFDPSFGTRFSTYASYWIKQSIRAALTTKSTAIRLPVYMINVLRKWHRAHAELLRELGHEPAFEQVADRLGLDERRRDMVRRALQAGRVRGSDAEDTGSDFLTSWADEAESSQDTLERAEDREQLRHRLHELPEREQAIIELRFGLDGHEPRTLREVGDQLGMTREWVRRIEIRAMSKLGATVRERESDELARKVRRLAATAQPASV